MLRRIARVVLPSGLRQFLRANHRQWVFRRAWRRFLSDPARVLHSDDPTLRELVYGWGNDWSAQHAYLAKCVAYALSGTGPILECGSGLSTLLVGAVARTTQREVWTLEHDAAWAGRVSSWLARYQIDSVRMCVEPLTDYGEFAWYTPPLAAMPGRFSLVICDGPPWTTSGGRYGLVPIMRSRLTPGTVILLDDADREEELRSARRWAVELGAPLSIEGANPPHIEMIVSRPAAAVPSGPAALSVQLTHIGEA